MRVYNITQANSIKSFILDTLFILIITLIPFIACIFDFNFITFPILFCVLIIDIIFFINLYKKRKDYNNTKNFHNIIEYVDFNPDELVIYANSNEDLLKYISYKYKEIENITIELETYDSSTTRKHYTGIRDIAVYIHTNDGSDYVFHSYHLTFGGSLRTVYDIIDYARKTNNISYKLKGTGDQSEIIEKLDFYINNRRKLRVEHSGRKDLKILSIIIFLWGCAISIIAIAPFGGAKGTIISCITFAIIAILIYFPVILDKKEE